MYYIVTIIFAPNREKLDVNLKSLKSIVDYLNYYKYETTLIIGGWAINNEYWNEIERYIKTSFKYSFLHRYDKNCGKAYIINDLVKNNLDISKTEYFFTIDSDIIIPIETEYLFDRLYEIPKQSENHFKTKKFGFVALNQAEHNCHNNSIIYANTYLYTNKYKKKEKKD